VAYDGLHLSLAVHDRRRARGSSRAFVHTVHTAFEQRLVQAGALLVHAGANTLDVSIDRLESRTSTDGGEACAEMTAVLKLHEETQPAVVSVSRCRPLQSWSVIGMERANYAVWSEVMGLLLAELDRAVQVEQPDVSPPSSEPIPI